MRWTDAVAASALALSVHAISIHEQIPLDAALIQRPNIVFILTDDQDVHLDSLKFMPFVQKHLLSQGTYYSKHYCTTAVCCPSRATLWTGKAAHNTNITDVNPPYGECKFATSYLLAADLMQVATQNLSLKASMRTIFQFGYRRLDTTPITRENCSMFILLRTTTRHIQQASMAL
jgi:hypothetical protein